MPDSNETEEIISSIFSNSSHSTLNHSRLKQFIESSSNKFDVTFICDLFAQEDKFSAYDLIERHAYIGSPLAQLMVGVLKLNGVIVTKNVSEGIFWLKRSYIGKNPRAGFVLFSIYSNGTGVKTNMSKALEYIKGTADFGDVKAQYYYAKILLGTAQHSEEMDKALNYMLISAEGGYEDAVEFLRKSGVAEYQR